VGEPRVALVRLGRFDEAIAAYGRALQLDGGNAALRMNLALAYYKKGDARGAAADLETLQKSAPADPRIAALLSDCYLQMGEKERSLAVVAGSAQAHPEDLDLSYAYGSALIANGRQKEGIPLVERVAKERGNAEAYVLAGKTWLKVGDADHALKDLEEAARLDANVTGFYTFRGIAREGTFDEKGAESDLRKALELNPNDLEAAVHLGGILYARRDLAGAKTYLDRALTIDPSSQFARVMGIEWLRWWSEREIIFTAETLRRQGCS
jgi:Flp pilus assembly protein TadD